MKKVLVFIGIVFFISFLTSCGGKKVNEEDDVTYNPALIAKDNLKAYKKAAKIARKQMRDLEKAEGKTFDYIDTAEVLGFRDDLSDRQKKNDEPEPVAKKDTCCPSIVQNFFNASPPPPAKTKTKRKPSGGKTQKKPDCPDCPDNVKPVTPAPANCGDKKIYVNGEEYQEYHGPEAPASAPGIAKPGYHWNPKDSMWYKKN